MDIEKMCAESTISIAEGIRRLDEAGHRFLMITEKKKLVGVITDGDIRRRIIHNGDLNENIQEIMCHEPIVLHEHNTEKAKELMLQKLLIAIPVLNEKDEPVDVFFIENILNNNVNPYGSIDVPVVIMAGGKGTRLRPFTNVLPKPLIPINDKTILERIIDSFRKNNADRFYLTLNYKKNLIKAYFDELPKNYTLTYVEEQEYCGTCGSLCLLKNEISDTFILSNCDVLLDIDYSELLNHHKMVGNEITAVSSLRNFTVPYGVFETDSNGLISQLKEKPEFMYQVNTGIYVLDRQVLDDIPENRVFHMTDLMQKLMDSGRKVGVFPVTEKCWQDMGEFPELNKMLKSMI